MTFQIRWDEIPDGLIVELVKLMEEDGLPKGAFDKGFPKWMTIIIPDEDINNDAVSQKPENSELFDHTQFDNWFKMNKNYGATAEEFQSFTNKPLIQTPVKWNVAENRPFNDDEA